MTHSSTFQSSSLAETESLAASLAGIIETPLVIRLDGTLGAGKTQFVKGLALALGASPEEVTSPTFVLLHRYPTQPIVFHLDVYRVEDEDEFLELGVEELFEEDAVTIIEWGEKFRHLLPADHLAIEIDVLSESLRQFRFTSSGPHSERILRRLEELRESSK